MKTWSALYLLVWLAFFQILIIMFPLLGLNPTYDLHSAFGILVVGVAMYAFHLVKKSSCPERIKRIAKTTAILGVVQGILGIILFAGIMIGFPSIVQNVILFLHVVNALAIITQASSSATAFDMWEEKEFLTESKPLSV